GGESSQRYSHVAALLSTGEVLVTGGGHFNGSTTAIDQTSELYDPTTGVWSLTGSMTTRRFGDSVSLLPNGKVLIIGGFTTVSVTNTAELYDRTTGLWTLTGSMNTARYSHTATVRADGKVLVAGGSEGVSGSNGVIGVNTTELYDPTSGLWSASSPMISAR